MNNFSVIIPAFNEAEAIGSVLDGLLKEVEGQQIIVVDDGSEDGTGDIALEKGVTVVRHEHNRGYGAALKSGIRKSEAEHVVFFDADGQHSVPDMLKVVGLIKDHDMVVGTRDSSSHKDWLRVPGKAVLGFFANILTSMRIPDLTSGLRAFRRAEIKKYLHLMPDGFSFSTTSTVAFLRMNKSVHYVDISTRERVGRASTVHIVNDGIRVMMLIVNLIVLFSPMRIFLPLSMFFVLSSLLYVVLYCIFVRIHITPSAVMLFITGVLLFSLGIICEQISALRREMHQSSDE